jgi:hypothetical protein
MQILRDEFEPEGFVVRPDRLDISLGFDGAVIGVSPDSEVPNGADRMELLTGLTVQFYGHWNTETDPNDIVDPTTIETYAWRFRQAVANYRQTGTSDVWWFQLDSIEYGDDPAGNCTRFVAAVTARGANPAF